MKRRSLLVGSGGLLLAAALGGCRRQSPELRVDLLQDAIPPALLTELQQQLRPAALQVKSLRSLDALYQALRLYHQAQTAAAQDAAPTQRVDLVSLGDAWLTSAIREHLIQPLTPAQIKGWEQLPSPWRRQVQRDRQGFPNEAGSIWGAPYQWGSLAIAYRKDELADRPPRDWDALWQPQLTRRISLPDQARAVLGLTLKHLGHSANTTDPEAIAELPQTLAALNQQALFYSSTAYLEPLILGDTWLAVGWSTDIFPVLKRNPRLAAIVPRSGTILTSDLWVQPTASPSPPDAAQTTPNLIDTWIQYYWQPEVATRLTLLGNAASPMILGDRATLPTGLQNNALLLPDPAILERSEFLEPLTESTAETYRRLWTAMRTPATGP